MVGMNIQNRYNDIAARAGLSEEIVRRVLKASRESLAISVRQGERATLPGICIMIPTVKNRINPGGTSMTSYIKLKTTPSAAMESEIDKLSDFNEVITTNESDDVSNDEILAKLNFKNPDEISLGTKQTGIRTSQISALL